VTTHNHMIHLVHSDCVKCMVCSTADKPWKAPMCCSFTAALPMAPKLSMKAWTYGLCCTARRQRSAKSVRDTASFCSTSACSKQNFVQQLKHTCTTVLWKPLKAGVGGGQQCEQHHSPQITTIPTRPTVKAMKPMGRPRQKYVNCW
jgi:hypothetical protein